MKIRCSFVTNSSTSNMILGLKFPMTYGAINVALYGLKDKHPEEFAKLPIEDVDVDMHSPSLQRVGLVKDIKDFSIQLAGITAGHSFDRFLKWAGGEMGYRHPNLVKDSSRDLSKDDVDNFGEFPMYAYNLKKEGYHVYMVDINDFSAEDDIMTRLCEWAGHVVTDDFVLKVASYY